MEQQIKKFLEFNGKTIYFLAKDGQYWIAIKPICEALGVDYIEQHRDLKKDKILSQLLCEHTMVAADLRARKMTCLPEKFVYGWVFSLKSRSSALAEYKLKCYEILFDYFHGAIVGRKELITELAKIEVGRKKVLADLMQTPEYIRLQEFDNYNRIVNKKLKRMDRSMLDEQLGLFTD